MVNQHFDRDEAEFYQNQIEFLKKYAGADAPGFFGKISRVTARIAKKSAQKRAILAQKKAQKRLEIPVKGLNFEPRNPQIIVSLTSFPRRISIVPAVIGSLLRQTMKPDQIILYLAKAQFDGVTLPDSLLKMQEVGVKIEFVDDLKPHKKYYYAMQEYPDACVITVDDDVLYDEKLVETLYSSYLKHPNDVSCMRCHKLRFDRDGQLLPYWEWTHEYNKVQGVPSAKLIPTGCGGVLYPPKALPKEAFDAELILSLCLSQDDLWLKTMTLRAGRKTVLCGDSKAPLNDIVEAIDSALAGSNLVNGNDEAFKKVLAYFNMDLFSYMDDNL